MKTNNAGYIIGAYPCAPSFHQRSEEEEKDFWRQLSETQTFWGWNNLAWKIFTRWAINGYSVIRQRAGNLSSPQ